MSVKYKYRQISLKDTFSDCQDMFVDDAPSFFQLLYEHFDIQEFIPSVFRNAFYQHFGRTRDYPLEAFLSLLILLKIFSIPSDSLLLLFLRLYGELRDSCGFSKVPDASLLARFKQNFEPYIEFMFQQMVDYTEPICQMLIRTLWPMLLCPPMPPPALMPIRCTSTGISVMPTSSPSLPTDLVLSTTLPLLMMALKRPTRNWLLKRKRILQMKINQLVTLPLSPLSFPTSFLCIPISTRTLSLGIPHLTPLHFTVPC